MDQLQALFNNVGPAPGVAPAGSVRDSVLANSNGQLTINSVFTGAYRCIHDSRRIAC